MVGGGRVISTGSRFRRLLTSSGTLFSLSLVWRLPGLSVKERERDQVTKPPGDERGREEECNSVVDGEDSNSLCKLEEIKTEVLEFEVNS